MGLRNIPVTKVAPGMILADEEMGIRPDSAGRWPVVTEVRYDERAVGGKPAVCIMTDAKPGEWYMIRPDLAVTIRR